MKLKHKILKTVCLTLCFCLLAAILLFALLDMLPEFLQAEPAPAEPTALLTIAPPASTSEPTPGPTPEPTIEPAPESAPETKTEWTLSFAGDCTIGTLDDWQSLKNSSNMLHVIGNDYSYPFSAVKKYFESDDLTIVNLEGAFTDETQSKSKNYCFKADPEYAKVLTEGSIEAVSLANNHSGDYLEVGLEDTKAALDGENILYTDDNSPLITQLEGGLKLGIVSFNCVEIDLVVGDVDGYLSRIEPMIDLCKDENCGIIVAFMHWGWEYRDEPESWMLALAHALADYGCDIVIGSHNHELLRSEDYNGVPIFYSLGNFCYGGHSDPDDKDSVIVQQRIVLENGEYKLGELSLIPCSVSHSQSKNAFCPMPYNEGSVEYGRVLKKLDR